MAQTPQAVRRDFERRNGGHFGRLEVGHRRGTGEVHPER